MPERPGMILQAAMDEFCRRGAFDRHVARMHRTYRQRMAVALAALRAHVRPEWARWVEPRGGYLIWLTLPRAPGGEVEAALAAEGVRVVRGRHFFASVHDDRHVRLSISTLSHTEIGDGIARLGRAFAATVASTRAV